MKPAAFEYYAPTTVDAVVKLLEEHGSNARLLAGGQTLLPMMNFRLATPEVIIDLNRIPELAYIRAENGHIHIGAMTRQRAIEFSPLVQESLPLLHEAIRLVGHLPTRSRGTIGGSIANADSAAELPMILQVLDGEVRVLGPRGVRTIPATDLFLGAMTTSIGQDEVLTEICFPVMPAGARFAVEEFSRRRGDFAIAAVAAMVVLRAGACVKATIATAGISAVSSRLTAVESALERRIVDDALIETAANIAAESVEPLADSNASEEFRRHLAKVLTSRVLTKAVS